MVRNKRRLFLVLMMLSIVFGLSNMTIEEVDVSEKIRNIKEKQWECMVDAICHVESRGDDNARSRVSSAAGRFQMLRIYVDEVNRISGKKIYSYNDRFNPVKAREMFDIYQGYYNPERDIDKAIILHRGKKSWKYIREVKNEMSKRN